VEKYFFQRKINTEIIFDNSILQKIIGFESLSRTLDQTDRNLISKLINKHKAGYRACGAFCQG